MFKKSIKPLGILGTIIFMSYCIHQIIFKTVGFSTTTFQYSLNQLYLFFGLFSFVIVLVLIKVKEKNLDIVGNTFLLLTSVKMMVCYVFGRPIIKGHIVNSLEKWNFFTLFVLFLLFETLVTIILLNRKN
jgi:hypothetical protein